MSSFYWSGSSGSSVNITSGSSEVNFGLAPGGNYAYVNVTGQNGITTTSSIRVWISASSTADHNSMEHLLLNANAGITYGDIIVDEGFTIYVVTELRVSGIFKINWEWL